jgi:hypothetical protein
MKVLFLVLGSLSAIIYGCRKSPLTNGNSAAKDQIFANGNSAAKGHIFVVDQNNHLISDYSGVNISSENSDITTIPVNANGEFNFPTLTNDRTSLILNFSKIGYGTVKQYYTKALLDSFNYYQETPRDIILIPQSSVSVNSLSGILDSNKFKMVCNVSVGEAKPANGVTFFLLKNNSQVSCSNWTGNIANSRTWTIPVTTGDNLNSFCITRTIECNCDFLHSGDTVYLKAYGDTYSPFGNCYYYLQTGQLIFPGMNTKASSATISFVVP